MIRHESEGASVSTYSYAQPHQPKPQPQGSPHHSSGTSYGARPTLKARCCLYGSRNGNQKRGQAQTKR